MEKHYKYLVPHLKTCWVLGMIICLNMLFSVSLFAQKPFSIPEIYDYDVAIDSIINPLSNSFKGNIKQITILDSTNIVYEDGSTYYHGEKNDYYFSTDGLQYKERSQVQPYKYKKITEEGKEQEQWYDDKFQQNTYTVQDGKLINSTHGNSFTNYTYTPKGKLFYVQMFYADTLDVGFDQLSNANEVEEQYISIEERLVHKLTYDKKNQISKKETFSSYIYTDTHLVTTIDNYTYTPKGKILGFHKKTHEYESPEYNSVANRLDQLNYKAAKKTSNHYEPEEIIISYNKSGKINKVEIATGKSYKLMFEIMYPSANKVLIDVTSGTENELQRWVYEKQRHYFTYDKKGNVVFYKNVSLDKTAKESINQISKRKIVYYE